MLAHGVFVKWRFVILPS